MAEPAPELPPLSAFEEVSSAFAAASSLPDMVVFDADSVLWPCRSCQLDGDTQLYPEVPGVMTAINARHIKMAIVGCAHERQQHVTSEEQSLEVNASPPTQQIDTSSLIQETLERGQLIRMIDHLHVDDEVKDTNQHWQSLRLTSGIPWSRCVALVGSADTLRAARRCGGAAIQVKAGLTAAAVKQVIQAWTNKLEDERGF